MPTPSPLPPSAVRRVGTLFRVALVLLCLTAAGLTAWHLWTGRQQVLASALKVQESRARALEQHLAGHFQQIDQALLSVRDEVVRRPAGSRFDPGSLQGFLAARKEALPDLEGLRVSDAAGRVHAPIPGEGFRPFDLSDRPYFQTLRQDRTSGLVISGPFWGRINSLWVVVFARRVEDAQGTFLGGVYATMTLETFRSLLADTVPQGMAAALAADGTVLCTHPLGVQPAGGQRLLAALPQLSTEAPAAHLIAASLQDGVERIHVLRRMAPQGLVLLAALPMDEVLGAWRREALLTAGLTVLLVGLGAGLGILSQRIWRAQRETQAELAKQAAMYRLLTESATEAIWTADATGKLQYVSPSIQRQRGYTPQEYLALRHEDTFADEEGRALFRQQLAATLQAQSLSQPFEGRVLQVNLLRKDGSPFPAEIHLGILWDAAGGLQGIRGVTRDITRRKAAETQRDELIEALTQALAELKTLKGMLPICCCCKKVRDDRGYWNQIEAYIAEHSEATFTHGYCPECARRQFPEVFTE